MTPAAELAPWSDCVIAVIVTLLVVAGPLVLALAVLAERCRERRPQSRIEPPLGPDPLKRQRPQAAESDSLAQKRLNR